MSRATIKTAIKNKLDTLKGSGQPLTEVYDEYRQDFDGFPVACFEPSDIESDYETTQENMRAYSFRIILFQEIEKVGRGQAIDILADIEDQVINAFDQDYTLGGACDWLEAVPSVWNTYDSGNGEVMTVEIIIKAYQSVDIS